MQTHRLIAWPEYFEKVLQGNKTFEIRLNDRNFEEGDIVELLEFDPCEQLFSGRALSFQIGFVLRDFLPGLNRGYCAFSLLPDPRLRTTREAV